MDEKKFYSLDLDYFVIAAPPSQRKQILKYFDKNSNALIEKPVSTTQDTKTAKAWRDKLSKSNSLILFDFPELFDPLTFTALNFFTEKSKLKNKIGTLKPCAYYLSRTKNREQNNAFCRRETEDIELDESAHALAFLAFMEQNMEEKLSMPTNIHNIGRHYESPVKGRKRVFGEAFSIMEMNNKPVMIEDSFKDPLAWKRRKIVSQNEKKENFTVMVDYWESSKSIFVYGPDNNEKVFQLKKHTPTITSVHKNFRKFLKEPKQLALPNINIAYWTYMIGKKMIQSRDKRRFQ